MNGLVPDLVHSSFNDSISQNCIYYVIVVLTCSVICSLTFDVGI